MIVSHKHQFIFVKPTKVAGTSVEINLAKQCGEKDIITDLIKFDKRSDSTEYEVLSRNISKDINTHLKPKEIKKLVGNKVWNQYYKITIIRNPWDQVISRFFWDKYCYENKLYPNRSTFTKIKSNLFTFRSYVELFYKVINNKSIYYNFEKSLFFFDKKNSNYSFYFDKKGNKIIDYYIRYENLEEDYKKLCEILNIKYEKLPLTKNKQRKEKKHYSIYYSEKTKKKIAKKFKKEIEVFNYTFENKK